MRDMRPVKIISATPIYDPRLPLQSLPPESHTFALEDGVIVASLWHRGGWRLYGRFDLSVDGQPVPSRDDMEAAFRKRFDPTPVKAQTGEAG